jgi:hypothetical protein
MIMMYESGIWIPQEVARRAGGGELLPGLNYDKALKNLKIVYNRFTGKNFTQFMDFTRKSLQQGYGVVTVVFIKGGDFDEYDHIVPIIGFAKGPSPDQDTIFLHSNYSVKYKQHKVSELSCTERNRHISIEGGGCIPVGTQWGYSLKGMTYTGIGPDTELRGLSKSKEPNGLGNKTELINATLRVKNMTVGKSYNIHEINDINALPKNKNSPPGGKVIRTFTATAANMDFPVSFQSARVAAYIVV